MGNHTTALPLRTKRFRHFDRHFAIANLHHGGFTDAFRYAR
jgi:hypothetical protein